MKEPIHLSLSVIERHLSEVIHDLTHREAIMQADKFLTSRRIVAAVDETLGPEVRRQFRPWLQHIANEWAYDRAGGAAAEKFLRAMRRNATFVGMAFVLRLCLCRRRARIRPYRRESDDAWIACVRSQSQAPSASCWNALASARPHGHS